MFIKAVSIGPELPARKGSQREAGKHLWMFPGCPARQTTLSMRRGREETMRRDEVLNQSPPYVDVDLYASDPPLQSAVAGNGGEGDAAALAVFGKRWGKAEMLDLARQANENPPILRT